MRILGAGLLLLAGLATVAGAECPISPAPLTAASPATAGYVGRYNILLAGDPYLFTGKMTPGWRALSADMKRDPAVPAELAASTEIMLAASLQKDAEVADGLAAAQSALHLSDAAGLDGTPLHAEIMTTLAMKEANAGKTADAVAHADKAIVEMARHFGARSWASGRAMMSATMAYNGFGRYEETERFAAQAAELASACLAPANPFVGQTITGHAAILGTLGRIDESLAEEAHALAWVSAYAREDDDAVPYLLGNYGWTLRNAGRFREAEAVLRRAVDLDARYHADAWEDRASVTGKFANVLAAEGYYVEAEAMWLKTKEYYLAAHDLSNPLGGSGELRRSADAAQVRGDLAVALTRRQLAIDLIASRAQPQHPELARARLEYASTLSLVGRNRDAVGIAEPAIARIRSGMAESDFKRLGAEVAYAQIVANASGAAAAYPIAAPVAHRLEGMLLDTATSRGDLVLFGPAFSSSFGAVTKFALATGRVEDAFHDLQLANLSEIVLVNSDIALRAAAASPEARALIDRLQEDTRSRRQLDHDRISAASTHDIAKLAVVQTNIEANDADIRATTEQLDRVFPTFRAIGRPTPVALAAYRARLAPDDILIAPVSLPGEAVTIAVTREGVSWASTPVFRSRTTALVQRLRRSIDAGTRNAPAGFDEAAARELYDVLIPAPLGPLLRGHRHILYYASGALATIPPGLLVASPERRRGQPDWLIRSHSISIVPALAASPSQASAQHDSFLGVGAPALGTNATPLATRGPLANYSDYGAHGFAPLTSLPYAARELRAMASMFGPDHQRLLLARAANETTIRSMPLQPYGVIAFATHGLLNDDLPGLTEPALVLTPPKVPAAGDDGVLTASEVANLRLDADWVILSACNTASGSDTQSASYSGLTRAFMEAGARALLVSHWPVRDDAADRLTVATLRATRRGVDRATALQQAMLRLMDDPTVPGARNPAIWAPFVLVER